MYPLSLAAKSASNDTFYFHHAMQLDDRDQLIEAIIKELDDHHRNKHWKLAKRRSIGNAKTIK